MTWIRLLAAAMMMLAGIAAAEPVTFAVTHLDIAVADGKRLGFTVEMASTPQQLQTGLMYRRSLAADSGMLFDFGHTMPVEMWMKNTYIPLDMVFIAADGRVTGVAERAVPQSLAIIASPGPVRAILELNGGTAARLGIHAGDRVVHPLFKAGS